MRFDRLTSTLVIGFSALLPAQGRPRVVSGVAYTIRVSAGPAGTRPADTPGAVQRYVGHAVFGTNRGRIDIVDGGVDSLFSKGDYMLFDSTDVVIVRPTRRDFVAVSRDAASHAMDNLTAMGVTITMSDQKVQLDSLGPSDTIAGVPSRHYRMTVAFNMSMDAGVMQQRLGTESVTDYWVAAVPGVPPNPLLRSNGFSSGGMTSLFKALSARVDSVSARMGSTIALRTRATSRVITGPGQEVQTVQTSEVSELRKTQVDQSALIIPPSYTEAAMPGLAGAVVSNNAAKWKKSP